MATTPSQAEKPMITVRPIEWPELAPTPPRFFSPEHRLEDIPLTLEVVLAETFMPLEELAGVEEGTVLLLGQSVEEPVKLYLQGQRIGEAEVVVIGEQFAARVTRLEHGAR